MSPELIEVKARPAEITARIVAAYVETNPVPTAGVTDLIANVSDAISKLGDASQVKQARLRPAVHPEQSVFAECIVCLDCGEKFAPLKNT
jgi:predicted transcriptional regulator